MKKSALALASAAAATMVAVPVAATERYSARVDGESGIGNRSYGLILAVLLVAAVIALTDLSNDDPVSP